MLMHGKCPRTGVSPDRRSSTAAGNALKPSKCYFIYSFFRPYLLAKSLFYIDFRRLLEPPASPGHLFSILQATGEASKNVATLQRAFDATANAVFPTNAH